jgi:hypothetical protein
VADSVENVVKEMNEYLEEYVLKDLPAAEVSAQTYGSATNATSMPWSLKKAPEDERSKLAGALGFHAQVNHVRLRRTAKRASEFYPQWRGFRLRAWRTFLPTRYPRPTHWQSYSFDVIPLRALKAIEAAMGADLFDGLEIWTPEHTTFSQRRENARADYMKFLTDPVCVGIVEGQIFPIVRWGREELIPEWRVMLVGGLRLIRPYYRTQRLGADRGVTARF